MPVQIYTPRRLKATAVTALRGTEYRLADTVTTRRPAQGCTGGCAAGVARPGLVSRGLVLARVSPWARQLAGSSRSAQRYARGQLGPGRAVKVQAETQPFLAFIWARSNTLSPACRHHGAIPRPARTTVWSQRPSELRQGSRTPPAAGPHWRGAGRGAAGRGWVEWEGRRGKTVAACYSHSRGLLSVATASSLDVKQSLWHCSDWEKRKGSEL